MRVLLVSLWVVLVLLLVCYCYCMYLHIYHVYHAATVLRQTAQTIKVKLTIQVSYLAKNFNPLCEFCWFLCHKMGYDFKNPSQTEETRSSVDLFQQ